MNKQNHQTKSKLRRVTAGIYKRYDGKYIQVIDVMPDIDTGEEIVVCRNWDYSPSPAFFAITKRSFCEQLLIDGKWVSKYLRANRFRVSESELYDLEERDYDVQRRIKYRESKKPENDYCEYDDTPLPNARNSDNYYDYAKRICENHADYVTRKKLCAQHKRIIGFRSKSDYEAMCEDLEFTKNCFQTVLREYVPLFKKRFAGEGLSIRKCAKDMGVSRGSVEYQQRKMFFAFAYELESRNSSDGIRRIREIP